MARLTPQQALNRLRPSGKRKAMGAPTLIHFGTFGNAEDDLYVFGNSDGRILTPADDTLPEILGTWEGDVSWGTESMLPPAMLDMLTEYANEVEWWERIGSEMAESAPAKAPAKAKVEPRQSVPAMLDTQWTQRSPYNDTIVFGGKTCATGCPATAAAQIMKYWGDRGYHRGCKATNNYVTATNGYLVPALPPLTVFDYPNLVASPKTDKEKSAVQQLMTYLGRAFVSDYKPNSTSAPITNIVTALRDKFRMGDIRRIYASTLGMAAFEKAVYEEMAARRPIIMFGFHSGGGHGFVIDGYDVETGMYHINWGWGKYNGWFLLTALNPTASTSYNSNKGAMTGIDPGTKLGDVNSDEEVNVTDAMQIIQDAQSGKYSPQSDINSDGKVTVADAQLIIDKILGRTDL